MKNQQLFSNRVAILATMHQKQQAIAPILEPELGIKIIVPPNFDTDVFGTFTRERVRSGTQIEAARLKATKALELTGAKLAIASEGSFAPHPYIPYIYSNREIVILLDRENGLEIIGEELSLETNFHHQVVDNIQQAYDFARKIGFPEHGLVMSYQQITKDSSHIVKGINTTEKLIAAWNWALTNSPDGKVYLETDMRAHYNPTRMKNIAKATSNLLSKLQSHCPQCHLPGFDITQIRKGLPCELCGMPTSLVHALIYQCQKCSYTQEKLFPDDIKFADPGQCMYCNP